MKREFEYVSYNDADRIAILENRAAELERRLLAATAPGGFSGWADTDVDEPEFDEPEFLEPEFDEPEFAKADLTVQEPEDAQPTEPGRASRTEALLNHGRRGAHRSRARWARTHWRMLAVGTTALVIGIVTTLLVLPGGGGSWPASVAQVKTEIKQACENPDVAAEPSGLNFACGKSTQAVLWVFALLTSDDNPAFVDQSTGRKGLEPIATDQGGNIAWPLNLHHPYNPGNPIDSLEVAARAINNIIGGATLTSSSGATVVEAGLESKPANCQRYTGSSQLVAKQGYPARCASAVTSPAGQAALVTDVFEQWMGGAQTQLANEAGTLFENADNPGDARVQDILATLPAGS